MQLQQLFANLISNSVKFCEGDPVIEISWSKLSEEEVHHFKELDDHTEYIKLVFKDNGIGFDDQYADKLFTIFQRLNHKHSYSGSGIGLALCKRIAENHMGTIIARGVPDQGGNF